MRTNRLIGLAASAAATVALVGCGASSDSAGTTANPGDADAFPMTIEQVIAKRPEARSNQLAQPPADVLGVVTTSVGQRSLAIGLADTTGLRLGVPQQDKSSVLR